MSLLDRLTRGEFVTPGTLTTPTERRLILARFERVGKVPTWVRLALTARLPVMVS